MAKNYQQIISELEARKFSPIYLLTGDESYYIDELTNKFEKEIIDESEKDFNFTLLYGRDTNLGEIISNAKQYPMMSDFRLVIIKEAQDLDKKEWEKLSSYIDNPTTSTIVVICFKYKTFDKSLAKKIDKVGTLFESKKLYDNQIPQWVSNYAKSINLNLDLRASALIADYLGNNLEKIANELSKLKLNLKQNELITIEHIEQHIGISKDYNVFELQTALGKRDILKANKIIDYFDSNPKDGPIQMVISTLFSFFSKALIASQVKDKTPENIAQAIGGSPYFAKDYLGTINIYPQNKLYQIISLLREYDLKSKGLGISPNASPGDLMKELVFKITH